MQPIAIKGSFQDQIFNAQLPTLEPLDYGRGGTSSVARIVCTTINGSTVNAYLKRQYKYSFRDWRSGFLKRPTVLREQRCILKLERLGVQVPSVLAYRRSGEKAYLITEALEGFDDFAATLARIDLNARAEIISVMVPTLLLMHAHRWHHGALHPRHILVKINSGGVQVALIGLEKMRRRLTARSAAVRDLSSLIRHTSELTVDDFNPDYEAKYPGLTGAVQERIALARRQRKYFARREID